MKIEHLALWARDIDALKDFYVRYFAATANDRYVNEKTGLETYFLTFDSGARLELMQRPDIAAKGDGEAMGYAHLAMSVGSVEAVSTLTGRLVGDGYTCTKGPRRTGDGYYESVVLDPEGNPIEITA